MCVFFFFLVGCLVVFLALIYHSDLYSCDFRNFEGIQQRTKHSWICGCMLLCLNNFLKSVDTRVQLLPCVLFVEKVSNGIFLLLIGLELHEFLKKSTTGCNSNQIHFFKIFQEYTSLILLPNYLTNNSLKLLKIYQCILKCDLVSSLSFWVVQCLSHLETSLGMLNANKCKSW